MNTFLISILNKSNSLVFSNSTLKLCLADRFIKIGFTDYGKKLLDKEYSSFCLLKLSEFSELVPKNSYSQILGIRSLEIEPLKHVRRDFSFLQTVYEKFNTSAKIKSANEVFSCFIEWHQLVDVKKILSRYSGTQLKIGPVHGDLHLSNIMKNMNGELKVIDLDLFRESWFREFDLINVLVSELILQKKMGWKIAFKEAFEDHAMLNLVDKEWSKKTNHEKSSLFYFYYLTRKYNEREILTLDEHENLLIILEIDFDR